MFNNLRTQAALGALALASVLVVPPAASALTATGTMGVSATVSASCAASATAVDFGTYRRSDSITGSSRSRPFDK